MRKGLPDEQKKTQIYKAAEKQFYSGADRRCRAGHAAAVVVLVLVDRAPAVKQPAAPDVANPTETGQPAETAGVPMDVSFPYALEDDGLELTSLFQYTGSNPGTAAGRREPTSAR